MSVAARRGAAELEELQRMLIERSIKDARCDEDGLGINGASDELLRGLLTAAMLAMVARRCEEKRASPMIGFAGVQPAVARCLDRGGGLGGP